MPDVRRREILGGAAALAGAFPLRTLAAQADGLPARSEFQIKNAYIISMDPAIGDIAGGSVHVKDGVIVAVGADVAAPGIPVFDGADMIVLPGLIDTHWHMWNTLFRSFAGDQASDGYFPMVARYGAAMLPADMSAASGLAAAEAINSGTTTVHSYCHNGRSRQHAEADIAPLLSSGLRGRWSLGWPQGLPDTEITDQTLLPELKRDWGNFSGGGMLSLGLGWRGQFRASRLPESVYRTEFEQARDLGLPISVHVGNTRSSVGQVGGLVKEKLIGPDVQLIHGLSANPEEIKAIKESGAVISMSPVSEMRIGDGIPLVNEFIAAQIPLGVSIDSVALTGNANLFTLLKFLCAVANATAESEFKLSPRRALSIGTIEGARTLGLDKVTGSLTPGKRADLIMISSLGLNMGVFTDAAHMVVECTVPENVDTVVADGRVLKRGGRLTALDQVQIVADARKALAGIRLRAKA